MMVTPSVKLVRPLGEGGMGAVWLAEHLALRTQVVVKFIASGLKGSKEAQERFSREAAAASQVKSPHVVQTFDHGITDDGIPYIVMELLEGRDLGEYLEQSAKVPSDLVVEIIGQLARALDRAHERGIIHRDIKPGNIFLSDSGRSGEVFVKLLDFGIAKGVEGGLSDGVDSGTKTGSMIGSPFYMSPEQILGSRNLDYRSDLWSVGVVAYEMLTGRKPFDAETMGGLAIRIHSEPLPLATTANPDLPISVDMWFARACARDVNARFASARELTAELARALGGEMPKSLEGAPRLSTASGERVNPVAATLVAGAATDAGVVSAAPHGRARSRALVLLAIVLILPPTAFFSLRAIRARDKDPGTALVPPDPHTATGAGASAGPSAATVTPPGSAASAMATGVSPADSALPVVATGKVPTHATRIRPGASAHVPPSASPLPLPPVTSTATPRPATSGHDIF